MYRLRNRDKRNAARKISDSLLHVPLGEMEEVLRMGINNIREQELDTSAYKHCGRLIKIIRGLLEKEDYNPCFNLFFSSNHGHSGWTEDISRIYYSPRNETEKGLSLQLEALIFEVIESFSLRPLLGELSDNSFFYNLGMISSLLDRLGQECSKELFSSYRDLVFGLSERDIKNPLSKDIVRDLIRDFERE